MSSLICGKNDLETWCVENGLEYILFEWDDQLNGNLRPSGVARSSNKPVWWKCKKCEKSYQTSPGHRTGRGSGCPICAKEERKKSWAKPKENMSFSDLFPANIQCLSPANTLKFPLFSMRNFPIWIKSDRDTKVGFFLFKLLCFNTSLFFCPKHNIVSGRTMFNKQFL